MLQDGNRAISCLDMEIPRNIQDKLKCSECDELLSCGPVYILHETEGTICGRCSQQSDENDAKKKIKRSRNDPYEATASLLKFPCAFASRGCPETVEFTLGQPPHESNCEFRPFICPIAPLGSCDWIGTSFNLKEHCDENHPLNVLQNPCTPPKPDLTCSNLQSYLISAFRFLFLLQIKVCLTSGKLFHSIRMFGNSKFLDKFTFNLEIEGNNIKVTKLGAVLRPEILTIQESSAVSTAINNLLGILDGKYDESKFTITIKSLINFNCVNCLQKIKNVSDSKFCEKCQEKLVKCKFSDDGCLFMDVNNDKCSKHENLFCVYQKSCCECSANLGDGTFIEHLTSSASCEETTESSINSIVSVTNTNSRYKNILFSTNNIGTIICEYSLSNCILDLSILTSLPSHELKNFKCSIELTDPQTKQTQILKPKLNYNKWCDWSIYAELNEFPSWSDIGIDMKIFFYNIIMKDVSC